MSVTAVHKNPAALTLTVVSEFKATQARVWELWANPRQLERWWGPPTYPATVTSHELRSGGHVAYHMTGPTGDQPHGYWEFTEVDPPSSLTFSDGFANPDGTPDRTIPPATVKVTIEGIDEGRTRMSIVSLFPNREAMETMLKMGMEEGMTAAVGQIDALLEETPQVGA